MSAKSECNEAVTFKQVSESMYFHFFVTDVVVVVFFFAFFVTYISEPEPNVSREGMDNFRIP